MYVILPGTVDAGTAQVWFIAGTIPCILAGGLHAVLAVVDAVRPTYFSPRDDGSRQPAMEFWGPVLLAAVATTCFVVAAI